MTSQLFAVCFDASDPERVARFWSRFLDWETADEPRSDGAGDGDGNGDGITLLPGDDTGFRLRFRPSRREKTVQNRMHFDLTSTSPEDQQQTVARALELGARHIDVGQRPEEGHVVLADPEGNEFCVIAPGNAFLAECGFIGALASDGSQAVGYFWSKALGWPLVWDQDEETAIRSPHGGPKITWGGPPLMPRGGRDRVRYDLCLPVTDDQQAEAETEAEVERLLSLGATRVEEGTDGTGQVTLADPDGNEFRLLTSR